MTAAMNVGTLVGYLTIDDKGVDQGIRSATGKIQQFAQTGATAGARAGGAVGSALATGVSRETSKLPGLMSGPVRGAVAQLDQLGSEGRRAGELLKAPPQQLAALAKTAGISVDQLKADLTKTANEAKETGAVIEESSSRGSAALKQLAVVAASAFAFDKIATFFGDSIQASSDLQQTVSKSSHIFGEQAQAIEDWSKTSATAFGLSQAAALEAAATFGDMFRQLGFAGTQAASMSKDVVQLAADLGSFNNVPTGEVLDDIAGAMRGEYDALQRLIPNISAARVQQEAMTETGKTNANALTAQEKAAATLAIIHKDGIRAAGDFARSTGQLAIEQQKATARFENAKAEIGDKLIPVMTDLTEFGSNVLIPMLSGVADVTGEVVGGVSTAVTWFGQLPGPVKDTALALGVLAVAAKLGWIDKFRSGLGAAGAAVTGFRASLSRIGDDAAMAGVSRVRVGLGLVGDSAKRAGSSVVSAFGGPWGIALAAAPLAIDLLSKAFENARPPVKDFSAAIDENTGKLRENADAAVADTIKADLLKWKQLGGDVGVYTAAVEGNTAAQAKMRDELSGMYATRIKDTDSWKNWGDQIQGAGYSLDDLARAMASGDPTQLRKIQDAFAGVTGDAGFADSIFRKFSLTTSDVTAASRLYAASVGDMNGQLGEAKVVAEGIAGAQKENAKQTAAASTAMADATLAHVAATRALNDYGTAVVKTSPAVIAAKVAQTALTGANRSAKDAIQGEADAADLAFNKHRRLALQTTAVKNATADLSGVMRSLALQNMPPVNTVLETASAKSQKLSDTIGILQAELDRLSGRDRTAEEATKDFYSAMDQAEESAKDADGNIVHLGASTVSASGKINLATESGRGLYDQVTAMGDAARTTAADAANLAGATGGSAAAAKAASGKMEELRNKFIANAAQMGLTRAQAKALADQYFGIPSQVSTTVVGKVNFDAVDKKLRDLEFNTAYVNVRGKWVGVDGGPGGIIAGANSFRAAGGPVNPYTDYVVGEKGWEILRLGAAGGHVFNHEQSEQMMAASPATAVPARAAGGPVGNDGGNLPIVRQVTYQINAMPTESVDSLVAKIDRRAVFYERVGM